MFLYIMSNISAGDGVNWPMQARDQDSDRLLDDDRDEDLSPGEESPSRGNSIIMFHTSSLPCLYIYFIFLLITI